MADEKRIGRNWAVAVVHGVGNTEPIDIITRVTGAVSKQRPDLALEPYVRVHPLDQKTARKDGDAAGAGEAAQTKGPERRYVREGRIGQTEVRFAAAHWSDISLFGEGLIKLIGNIALGGMGVRYFADVGTSSRSLLARALHGLLTLKIWLLALGFLPVVLTTLVFSLYTFAGWYLFRAATFWAQAWAISIFSLLTIWGLSWLGLEMLRGMRKDRGLAGPIFWSLCLHGTAVGIIMLLDHPRTLRSLVDFNLQLDTWLVWAMSWYGGASGNRNWIDRIALLDETSLYIGFLQLLQYIYGFGVIFLTAAVLVVLGLAHIFRVGTREDRRGMRLGAVSVTTMWLLMLLMLWLENVVTGTVINQYFKPGRPFPQAELWTLSLQGVTPVQLEPRTLDELKTLLPLIWFDVLFAIYLIGVAALVGYLMLRRRAWRKSHANLGDKALDAFRPVGEEKKIPWGPRYILARSYQIAALLFMLAISATALTHYWERDGLIGAYVPFVDWLSKLPHEFFMVLANVTLLVIVGVSGFLFAAHKIRNAVKLALDVVNHFAAPSRGFPIRVRIAERLRDTLKFLLVPQDKPHLVVICHSQGTVITLDTLLGYNKIVDERRWLVWRKRKMMWQPGMWETGLKDQVSSLTILTFGSPITHLYQHYFSTLYPRFATIDELKPLAAARRSGRLRWFNCYRLDDYIGTYIDHSLERFPVNVPMPVGGHTRYWEDDVFRRLFAEQGMEHVLIEVTPELAKAWAEETEAAERGAVDAAREPVPAM